MKKNHIFIFWAVVILLLTGCSATSSTDRGDSYSGRYGQTGNPSGVYLSNYTNFSENAPEDGRYVIAQARIYLQTKQYENFNKDVLAKLKEVEGYVENRTEENVDSGKLGNFIFKVPTDKLDEFSEWINKNATVISSDISKTDVTDEFIETGSRKKALEAEEKALLAILEKAETIDDIIKVQDRISNVRSELESYALKVQRLNNQIAYSTIYINLREVDRIATPSQSFSSLAGSGFMASVGNIGAGLRNLAIWFVGISPYLIITVIILVPAFLLIRRHIKRRKAKKD